MNVNKYNDQVTVVAVSFYSDKIVDKFINSIDKNIKILIVENYLNLEMKDRKKIQECKYNYSPRKSWKWGWN